MNPCPLLFSPIFKPKIWGGRRIETHLDKPLPPETAVGESWEVADLEDDQSVVASGPAAGKTLGELVREWKGDLLGSAKLFEGRFPLLIKYLDACQHLSVQVHPDAAMAQRLGGIVRLKDEAWYIVDAEPDGCIYRGFKPGITREDFLAAIDAGTVESTLHRIPVKAGHCYYLPSGTVHALGAGVLVAEIQTPSDVTYRVYDWDRVEPATGKGRELHIDRALECASFEPFDGAAEQRRHVADVWTTITRLITSDAFVVERVRKTEGMDEPITPGRMAIWMVLSGNGQITMPASDPCRFSRGDTILLPAGLGEFNVQTDSDCVWLEVTVPEA